MPYSELYSPFAKAAFAAALSAPLLAGSIARAHESPMGWKYPFSCCSNHDCKAIGEKAISERPEGYVVVATGEVVTYADRRVKDSPDGLYHWCAHQAGIDAGRTICLFVPPKGY